MMPFNVAGDFWQQLPAAMQNTWTFPGEAIIELECEDASRKQSAMKKEIGRTTWQYQVHRPRSKPDLAPHSIGSQGDKRVLR